MQHTWGRSLCTYVLADPFWLRCSPTHVSSAKIHFCKRTLVGGEIGLVVVVQPAQDLSGPECTESSPLFGKGSPVLLPPKFLSLDYCSGSKFWREGNGVSVAVEGLAGRLGDAAFGFALLAFFSLAAVKAAKNCEVLMRSSSRL